MNKNELKKDDVLVFKNNNTAILGNNNISIINHYYDDELNCLSNDDYTIVKVYRPKYEVVYEKGKSKKLEK